MLYNAQKTETVGSDFLKSTYFDVFSPVSELCALLDRPNSIVMSVECIVSDTYLRVLILYH